MFGKIIVSTYTESIKDLNQKYNTPFCALDLLVQANNTVHGAYLPEFVRAHRKKIHFDGHHYWHYRFAFDTDTLYPGQCISHEKEQAMGYHYLPLSMLDEYAFSKRLYDIQSTAMLTGNISAGWFVKRIKLLAHQTVGILEDHMRHAPTYRHVVEIKSNKALQRVLLAVRDFFQYRPHETHYAIQGLMLAARVTQANLAHRGKLYKDFEALITHYPRAYFKPRSGCEIYPKDDLVWRIEQSYQYIQMAIYLHQLIRRSLYHHGQGILDLDWLGYGRSAPEVLCRDIYTHLIKNKNYSPQKLAHEIEFRVVRFANGYENLPGVLRILPDQVSYLLMKGVLAQESLNQKAIWRLIDALKYHRMPPMPIEYLTQVYDQLVRFKYGPFIILNRYELFGAYCLQRVPDGSIDLKLGEPELDQLMTDKLMSLIQKKQFNPKQFSEKKHRSSHHASTVGANQVLGRIRDWFMNGS